MITVNILNKDINRGVRFSEKCCPIANSIKRVCRKNVTVLGGSSIYINDKRYSGDGLQEIKKINSFIQKFDDGRKVKPNKFKLVRINKK